MFNLNQFMFVIDLACLAARRDFLKLDKFIEDKLETNGVRHITHYILQDINRQPSLPPPPNLGGGPCVTRRENCWEPAKISESEIYACKKMTLKIFLMTRKMFQKWVP